MVPAAVTVGCDTSSAVARSCDASSCWRSCENAALTVQVLSFRPISDTSTRTEQLCTSPMPRQIVCRPVPGEAMTLTDVSDSQVMVEGCVTPMVTSG